MTVTVPEKAPTTPAALPVLYSFRRCPYAMRARLALAASGVGHEHREVVLKNKPPELLAASPKGTVPVLVLHGGEVIDQSLDIMRWALAQRDPGGWLPADSARLREMLALIATNDGPFKRQLDRYKYPHRYPDEHGDHPDPAAAALAFARASRAAATAHLLDLERRLEAVGDKTGSTSAADPGDPGDSGDTSGNSGISGDSGTSGPWLFGPQASLADMALAPFVRQFAHTDPAWFAGQPWPLLQAWLSRFEASALFLAVMDKHPAWAPLSAQAQSQAQAGRILP